ncbi:MAG: histidinol dehydrogenase [Candidatus Saganbacteria bacterium]|uniref:Histidinol dehydrogenase n=1 Tax=Candidatus Saganbacteria bacterium TaxID=2575572 RepID=A0A833KZS4_UNCSA|nr:MAG: histidinol dehydrogenase [Candidatus Saganbacteria bacterium]
MIKIVEKGEIENELEKIIKSKSIEFNNDAVKTVGSIIEKIKKEKDKGLKELTLKYDKQDIEDFRVPSEVIETAYKSSAPSFLEALRKAKDNIESFHAKQKKDEWFEQVEDDVFLGMRVVPIESVGVYVPGGSAAYPSTVLMNVIPAIVAGVSRITIASPPKISPLILAAAAELGVSEIYQMGGAQAIAALAYGTETIPKVDKIVGPGNLYVALAKKMVFGAVGIDSLAGPSDIVIVADCESDANFIAADLLAQSEHDAESSAILITDSKELASKVMDELEKQIVKLKRKEIAEKALNKNGKIFLIDNLSKAPNIVNQIAPEHLEILSSPPQEMIEKIKNAGAIFLGPFSPVAVGDYMAGPNHVLPTGGTARFSSPLSVYDFIKRQSIVGYTKAALEKTKSKIQMLAELEGLDAHARSIEIRFS